MSITLTLSDLDGLWETLNPHDPSGSTLLVYVGLESSTILCEVL